MSTNTRRIVGGYMFLSAIAVAVSLPVKIVVEREPELSTWGVLNWFIALAVVFALIACVRNKITLPPDQKDIREYLEVNLSFYGSLILTMWFFLNWVRVLTSLSESQIMWWFIYPLFIVIVGINGVKLWKTANTVHPFPKITWFGPKPKKRTWRIEIQKLLSCYLLCFAWLVGLYFVMNPIIDDGNTGSSIWPILDWIIGSSIVVAIAFSLKEKQQLKQSRADIKRHLETNTLFLAVIVLSILFFPNWLLDIMASSEVLMWWFIDALFAVAIGCSGIRMYNNAIQKQLELEKNSYRHSGCYSLSIRNIEPAFAIEQHDLSHASKCD